MNKLHGFAWNCFLDKVSDISSGAMNSSCRKLRRMVGQKFAI